MLLENNYQLDDLFNIIQPYAGYDLHKIITDRVTLNEYIPEREKLLLHFFNLLVGLGLLNKYDCVHRDIKPANITLLKGQIAKFIDFGLSASYNKSILDESQVLKFEWDWASTDYIYWPRDLKILSSSENNGLYTTIDELLIDKTREDSITILVEESAKLYKLYSDYNLNFNKKDTEVQFQSLVEFMIDVFIKKIFKDDSFDVVGHLIQTKWDVFSLGQTFSEILKRSKIQIADEFVKKKLHDLIISMVSLHPLKRPTIKECIEEFVSFIPDSIITKYNDEFSDLFRIAREQLEIEIEIYTSRSESEYGSDSELEFDLSDED